MKINIYAKISIVLVIAATIWMVVVIAAAHSLWWISTILYSIALVLSWGSGIYYMLKIKHTP